MDSDDVYWLLSAVGSARDDAFEALGLVTPKDKRLFQRSLLGRSINNVGRQVMNHMEGRVVADSPSLRYKILRDRAMIRDMGRIRIANNEAWAKLRKKLLNEKDQNNLIGLRLEILFGSLFSVESIPFKVRERPDLTFTWNGSELGMECRSLGIRKKDAPLDDLIRKVGDTLVEKANYAAPGIALALDITDLQSHATDHGHLLEAPTSLASALGQIQANLTARFGVILVILWTLESPNKATPSIAWCEDEGVDLNLMAFFTCVMPKVGHVLTNTTLHHETWPVGE